MSCLCLENKTPYQQLKNNFRDLMEYPVLSSEISLTDRATYAKSCMVKQKKRSACEEVRQKKACMKNT
jgi:hypothetical protein